MSEIELYGRDQTDFSHHGYVLDDVSNDVVTWQLNSKYTLTLNYPMFSPHASDLVAENIVRVPVPGGAAAFRISTVVKSMGMLSVTAYHVFWDLNDNFLSDTNVVGKDGQGALDQIMSGAQYKTDFKAMSTIGNVANARIVRKSIINALIGTDDNTFIKRWGGEFDWQDFTFSVNPRIGKDRGVRFEYAHNLIGYEATKDSSAIVTRLLPEGYNGLLLPELYVDSPLISKYRTPKIATKTYSDIKAIDEKQSTGDQDGAVPLEEAYKLLREAAAKDFSDGHIDQADWTYKLNVTILENTEEFKDLGIVTTVLPGDTVTITHPQDGIDVQARLTAYTWQPTAKQYLSQTYDSSSRPDVTYSSLRSELSAIQSQMQLIDKVTITKAANGLNSVTWSDQSPIDLGIKGKEGDIFYQETAKGTIMWAFNDGKWANKTSDAFGTEVQKKVDKKLGKLTGDMEEAKISLDTAKKNIATLQSDLITNEAAQNKLASDLDENAKIIADNKANIAANRKNIDNLDSKLATNSAAQEKLKKDLAENSKLVSDNKNDVDVAMQTVDAKLKKAQQDADSAIESAKNANSGISAIVKVTGPNGEEVAQLRSDLDQRIEVDGKIAAQLNLSADGGGTVLIKGASVYIDGMTKIADAVIQSAAIGSLDAAKITSGIISADRLATTKLNADNIVSGSIKAALLAATKLSATNITSGTLDASKLTVKNISADSITSGSIAAGLLAATELNASNIVTGTLDANKLVIKNVMANSITTGTLDAGKVRIANLDAGRIVSGYIAAERLAATELNADNITAGTLDAGKLTVKNLDASAINAGTLDAAKLNVININADSIATGTITGANLTIDLNSGQVVFGSGRIHDGKNNIDINIDPKGNDSYVSVANYDSRVLLKGGQIQFIQPQVFDLQDDPYLSISNEGVSSNWSGATIVGRDSVIITNSANTGGMLNMLGKQTFSGLMTGKNSTGKWMPTMIAGADRGVVITGGSEATADAGSVVTSSPYITVGESLAGGYYGNRIEMYAEYIHMRTVYTHTAGGSANVMVAQDGALVRTSSATKYKSNIDRFSSSDMGERLLSLPAAHWFNKQELQRYAEGEQDTQPKREYGMIAEDLAAAGLEDLVVRNREGGLEDIRYDRIAVALLPLVAKMKQEIETLKGA